jgi:hypothetical protein
MKSILSGLFVFAGVLCAACSKTPPPAANNQPAPTSANSSPATTSTKIASALPNGAFKASLAISDPPTKLRAGERAVLQVHVKNASDTNWPALGETNGRYAITLRNRWLNAGTSKVVNDIDGGTSLPRDLAPGAEIVLPLNVTAPAKAGDYDLEVDMVQEQVSFFREKGSQPAKISIKVE